jgi:hypothetical protein
MLADISMEVAIHLLVFDNVLAWIEMFASMFLYNVSCKHEHVSEAIAHMYAHIYAYIYIYIYAYICFKRTAEQPADPEPSQTFLRPPGPHVSLKFAHLAALGRHLGANLAQHRLKSSNRTAEQPNRRTAETPSRRTADSPNRRTAE